MVANNHLDSLCTAEVELEGREQKQLYELTLSSRLNGLAKISAVI